VTVFAVVRHTEMPGDAFLMVPLREHHGSCSFERCG
jgi:hypothetical protein